MKTILTTKLTNSTYVSRAILDSIPITCSSMDSCNKTFEFGACNDSVVALSVSLLNLYTLWHQRLGHPSEKVFKHVMSSCNSKHVINKTGSFCYACQYGKSHALPFPYSQTKTKAPLKLIHSDVWGPAPAQLTKCYRYYIHFIDDYSKHTWVYPLKQKFEALAIFKTFQTLVERQFSKPILCFQTN